MNTEEFLQAIEPGEKKWNQQGKENFPFRFLYAAARLMEGVIMETAHDFTEYNRDHLERDSIALANVVAGRVADCRNPGSFEPAVKWEMRRLRDLHGGDVFEDWPFGTQLFVLAAAIIAGTVYRKSRQYDRYDEQDLRLDGVQLVALMALNLEAGEKGEPAAAKKKCKPADGCGRNRKPDRQVAVSHRNYSRMQRFAVPMDDDFNSTLSKIMDLAEAGHRRDEAKDGGPEMFYDLMNRLTGRTDRRKPSEPGAFPREAPVPEILFREIPDTGAPKLEVITKENRIPEISAPEVEIPEESPGDDHTASFSTEEPAVEEQPAMAAEPDVGQPVVEEPGDVNQPDVEQPATAAEPTVEQPTVAEEPDVEQPTVEQPTVAEKPRRRNNPPPEPSTPQNDYRLPIMEALRERGGRAPAGAVIELVHQRMEQSLHPADEAKLGNGRPRWKKMVEWAGKELVTEGKLSDKSPRGTWELTAAGFSEVGGSPEPEYQLRESLR